MQTIIGMQIYELRPIRQKFELFYRGIVYDNKSHVGVAQLAYYVT